MAIVPPIIIKNMQSRVLILDGNSHAAVESLISLGRIGVHVDISSEESNCLAFNSRYAKLKLEQHRSTSRDFIKWLADIDSSNNYNLIIPSTEASLLAVMWLPEHDPLRIKCIIPSSKSLSIALDKQCTYEIARSIGIQVPESKLIKSIDEAIPPKKFPVVLKPVRSKVRTEDSLVSLSPSTAYNEKEMWNYLYALLPFAEVQQQEYIYGRGIGIEFLYDRGRMVWYFAHERLHELPLTGGGSTYRRAIKPPNYLIDAAASVLKALEWHGVAMFEFKAIQDGTFCLIEINPRLWGSLALSIDAGVNFPLGLLKIAEKKEMLPSQPDYKTDYYTRNIEMDIKWLKDNLRADHTNPMLLTRPHFRTIIEYLRPIIGKECWDYFDIKDLRLTWLILKEVFYVNALGLKRKLEDALLSSALKRKHANICVGIKKPFKTVLFVCFGNICRSPFAERIARFKIPGIEFKSTGFFKEVNRCTPFHLRNVAAFFEVELSDHRSSTISKKIVADADFILLMDMENYRLFSKNYPEAIERTTMLGFFLPEPIVSIADPYESSPQETMEILQNISSAIDGFRDWLNVSSSKLMLTYKNG